MQVHVLRRSRSIALAVTLLAAGVSAQAAPTPDDSGLVARHIDLGATLNANGTPTPDASPFDPRVSCVNVSLAGAKLFDTPPPEDHGWKALAHLLQSLTPSVDTDIPMTSSQITTRISTMLDQGQNQQALDVIEKRLAQEQASYRTGTDVQLMFLHGRALAALGRDQDAVGIYTRMTTLYPELPEPWNNLAALYAKQDRLAMAQDALHMALTADPDYASAQKNLGRVQLMLARQSLDRAAQLGAAEAQQKALDAQKAQKAQATQKTSRHHKSSHT